MSYKELPEQLEIPAPLDQTVERESGINLEPRKDRMIRLAQELLNIGVSGTQVTKLLMHDLNKVERQLAWIHFRAARKKASLIVSAIEQDYEAPANLDTDEK